MQKVRKHPHVPNNHHPVSLVIPRFTNMFSVKGQRVSVRHGTLETNFQIYHSSSDFYTMYSFFFQFLEVFIKYSTRKSHL